MGGVGGSAPKVRGRKAQRRPQKQREISTHKLQALAAGAVLGEIQQLEWPRWGERDRKSSGRVRQTGWPGRTRRPPLPRQLGANPGTDSASFRGHYFARRTARSCRDGAKECREILRQPLK
jgi:hypothetical protein